MDESFFPKMNLIPCQKCNEGHIPLGEHFVTYDMAMDAGDMSYVGMSMGIEWGCCPCCGGEGWEECENCTKEQETNDNGNSRESL